MRQRRIKTLVVTIITLGAIILMTATSYSNDYTLNCGSVSAETSKASLTKPVLTAKLKKSSLKLNWTKAEGADEYKIYRSKKKSGNYKKLAELTSDTLTFSDRDFKGERKKYFYKVKAVSRSGESIEHIYSNTIKKTVYKRKSKVHGVTYIDGILIANKTYKLPKNYDPGTNKNAYKAFKKMQSDARKDGINLFIASGYRSYSYQKSLYNSYKARDGKEKADTYSARAGHSEHQTGLAFDINDPSSSFENTKEAKWLASNCTKYGFIIRYEKSKEKMTGYKYEPWHIRYLGKDLAKKVKKSGKCLEEYLGVKSEYS